MTTKKEELEYLEKRYDEFTRYDTILVDILKRLEALESKK